MKIKVQHFLILLTIILSVPSCTPQTKEEKKAPSDIHSSEPKVPESVTVGTTELDGIWVNEKYLQDLLQHKSPRKSQDVGDVSLIQFTKGKALIIFGFYEGMEGAVIQKGPRFTLNGENGESKEMEVSIPAKKLSYNDETFLKQPINDENRIVETLLFAGNYDLGGKEVIFDENGNVRGLEDFTSYAVFADYADAGRQVDQLQLKEKDKDPKEYGFKFKGQQLIIYDLKCVEYDPENKLCGVVKNGEVKYKLKKKTL